jgi:hypothetical protein
MMHNKCLQTLSPIGLYHNTFFDHNGKEVTINRAQDGSTYPGYKLVHSEFGKINYGGLKHTSLYLRLILPSGG